MWRSLSFFLVLLSTFGGGSNLPPGRSTSCYLNSMSHPHNRSYTDLVINGYKCRHYHADLFKNSKKPFRFSLSRGFYDAPKIDGNTNLTVSINKCHNISLVNLAYDPFGVMDAHSTQLLQTVQDRVNVKLSTDSNGRHVAQYWSSVEGESSSEEVSPDCDIASDSSAFFHVDFIFSRPAPDVGIVIALPNDINYVPMQAPDYFPMTTTRKIEMGVLSG